MVYQLLLTRGVATRGAGARCHPSLLFGPPVVEDANADCNVTGARAEETGS